MPIPAKVRTRIYEREQELCARCGRWATGGSVHHRRARGAGGTRGAAANSPSNLALLCGSGTTGCHGWTEANRAESEALGWLLRHTLTDPADVPVLYRGGWMLLLPDGGLQALTLPQVDLTGSSPALR